MKTCYTVKMREKKHPQDSCERGTKKNSHKTNTSRILPSFSAAFNGTGYGDVLQRASILTLCARERKQNSANATAAKTLARSAGSSRDVHANSERTWCTSPSCRQPRSNVFLRCIYAWPASKVGGCVCMFAGAHSIRSAEGKCIPQLNGAHSDGAQPATCTGERNWDWIMLCALLPWNLGPPTGVSQGSQVKLIQPFAARELLHQASAIRFALRRHLYIYSKVHLVQCNLFAVQSDRPTALPARLDQNPTAASEMAISWGQICICHSSASHGQNRHRQPAGTFIWTTYLHQTIVNLGSNPYSWIRSAVDVIPARRKVLSNRTVNESGLPFFAGCINRTSVCGAFHQCGCSAFRDLWVLNVHQVFFPKKY